ncbi:MAG: hydroxymethylglutaryl-CoA lyase [Acidobacteriota bacterium]
MTGPSTPALPSAVTLIDVGPRDGFQRERSFIPTADKIAAITTLVDAGVREIEASAFVHPKAIPQMADAAQVFAGLPRRADVRYWALVPNLRGALRALDAGADGLRQVILVTDTYNRENVGLTVDESMAQFAGVVDAADDADRPASVILGASFGCPFEGPVPVDVVVAAARRAVAYGSRAIGLADSPGVAVPHQIREVVTAVRAALPDVPLWLHLHDTRGFGMANAVAGLELGITRFDVSFGGLGGCPVVAGAAGNIATEDMLYLCGQLGIDTGIDLDGVRAASHRIAAILGKSMPSRVLRAGTFDELVARNQAARTARAASRATIVPGSFANDRDSAS